jgi:hypothetical protein
MKRFVYLVIEDEALEDGTTHSSILCAYHEKADAEREAASHNGGRYMRWEVQEVEIKGASASSFQLLKESAAPCSTHSADVQQGDNT